MLPSNSAFLNRHCRTGRSKIWPSMDEEMHGTLRVPDFSWLCQFKDSLHWSRRSFQSRAANHCNTRLVLWLVLTAGIIPVSNHCLYFSGLFWRGTRGKDRPPEALSILSFKGMSVPPGLSNDENESRAAALKLQGKTFTALKRPGNGERGVGVAVLHYKFCNTFTDRAQ